MDIADLGKKITQLFKKYKYAILVLVVGLGLMLIPERSEEPTTEPIEIDHRETTSLNDRLAEILSTIDGAGKVEVLLSVRAGEETVYQTNNNITSNGENQTSQITTVMITTADKSDTGLVRQVNPPIYLGAIIVCQGADSPSVRLSIINAVSDATGLGADQISVLKMK